MRQDALARRNQPDAKAASDYEALCAALSASARGRAFLDEHARRARQADTALALEALTRLEALLRQRDEEAEAKARLRSELRALLAAVTSARTNFNKFEGTLAKRETVIALFDMLEQRATDMLADAPAEIETPANENEALGQAAETQAAPVETAAQRIIEAAEQSSPVRPRVNGDPESKPPAPGSVSLDPRSRGDEREKETTQLPEVALERVEPIPAQPSDIVARINALTPAERIALFS